VYFVHIAHIVQDTVQENIKQNVETNHVGTEHLDLNRPVLWWDDLGFLVTRISLLSINAQRDWLSWVQSSFLSITKYKLQVSYIDTVAQWWNKGACASVRIINPRRHIICNFSLQLGVTISDFFCRCEATSGNRIVTQIPLKKSTLMEMKSDKSMCIWDLNARFNSLTAKIYCKTIAIVKKVQVRSQYISHSRR
jgi:hypothetical protein